MSRIDPEPGVRYVGSGGSFRGEDAGIKPVPPDMQPDVKGVYVGGCIRTGIGTLKRNANASERTIATKAGCAFSIQTT